jgi:predicted branched-subunit amino acid permease
MEQTLSFLLTLIICAVAVIVFNSPSMLLAAFVSGIVYYAIRSKQKGWKLPKDISQTHS